MEEVEHAHSLPPEVGGELVQARRRENGAHSWPPEVGGKLVRARRREMEHTRCCQK
jgi:hypothetical protein